LIFQHIPDCVKEMTNIRETSQKIPPPVLDALRLLACFAVVVLHANAIFAKYYPDPTEPGWWAASICNAMVRWCVPFFVIITGFLSISSTSCWPPEKFYAKRLIRLLPVMAFWVGFYSLVMWAKEGCSLSGLAKSALMGFPYYHLWYLYMLLGLYLATPFLVRAAAVVPRSWRGRVCAVLFIFCSGLDAFLRFEHPVFFPWPLWFLSFLGYWFLGGCLDFSSRRRVLWLSGFFLACAATVFFASLQAVHPSASLRNYWYAYSSPTVILASIFLWRVGISTLADWSLLTRLAPWLEKTREDMLGIYVIHAAVLSALNLTILKISPQTPWLLVPFVSMICFGLSFAIVRLGKAIPVIRRVF